MSDEKMYNRWWESDGLLCFKSSLTVLSVLGTLAQWVAIFMGALLTSGVGGFVVHWAIGD